jgi:hypothetical protein
MLRRTGTLTIDTKGVLHITALDSGTFHETGTDTGTFTFVPDDPSGRPTPATSPAGSART